MLEGVLREPQLLVAVAPEVVVGSIPEASEAEGTCRGVARVREPSKD